MSVPKSWTIRVFSQANPQGDLQDDVPALLRKVADTIEGLGVVRVQDVVFHQEMDDEGDDRPSMTVYFWPTADTILELFAPFLRDAASSLGIDVSVRVEGAVEGAIFFMSTMPDGTGDGFRFDRQGSPDDHLLQALDSFDVLQESIHDFLARHRRQFGPWPGCPAEGHSHKLTVLLHPENDRPWWTCPEGTPITPLGELPTP